MIEIKNVTKKFDDFKALNEATLTVPNGAVYGLVGPNGAGKSTLIRCVCGVYKVDDGDILVDGEPVYENELVKRGIVVIPDEWYFHPQATIKDMSVIYEGMYPEFSRERYNKLKEVFRLDEKQLIRRMSKGMQKQAAFWLAMCCMPKYLVLDEPVDGLDPVMRRQIWSILMGDVSDRGTTVLVSSHNLRELEDVCDHVGILNEGKVLLERSLSDLQENTIKMQVVFREETILLPGELHVLHHTQLGRVHTYIIRGNQTNVQNQMAALDPLLLDLIPLTLEEIFIYELGGEGYEIQNIVL